MPLTDREAYAELEKLDVVECGYVPPLPRCRHYDSVTGMRQSLGRGCSEMINIGLNTKELHLRPPSWVRASSVSGVRATVHERFLISLQVRDSSLMVQVLRVFLILLTMKRSAWKPTPGMRLRTWNWPHLNRDIMALSSTCRLWALISIGPKTKIVFSPALTGKPARKEDFAQYWWKRCVIGTREDYAPVATHEEWEVALQSGNLHLLKNQNDDTLRLAPANNTDYFNVAAYLEAIWGYLYPAAGHNYSPQAGEWSAVRHSGLKGFIDHVVSLMGRAWQAQHVCTICVKHDRNRDGVDSPWSYMDGCLEHLRVGVGCIGSILNADSPETTGATMIPSTAKLLQKL